MYCTYKHGKRKGGLVAKALDGDVDPVPHSATDFPGDPGEAT